MMDQERIFQDNMQLNFQEIRDKKAVLASYPRKLNVALTTRCNLDCIMCEAKKITWEIPENTIKEIISFFPYLERIIWQGGEVFLFKSFKQILQQASGCPNLTHEITTNSHLINEDWIGLLKKVNLDLNISVDAFSEGPYERIRKGSKFSEMIKFLSRISEIKKAGGSKVFVLIFTVMKSNYRELPGVVDFAKRFNFDRVIVQPVKGNYNNDENIFYNHDLEAWEYIEKIKPKLKEEAYAQGIHLLEWLPTAGPQKKEQKECILSGSKEKKQVSVCENGLFCYAPWEQLFVEWGGRVYPHCLCLQDGPNDKREIGNVLENSLLEIWNNSKMQAFRQKIIGNDFQDLCSGDCVSGLIAANLRNLPSGPGGSANKSNLDGQDLAVRLQKGKAYISENKYDFAISEFTEVIARAPFNAEARFELGKAHYLKGSYPLAIKELLESKRIDPQDANSRLLLAKLYKATGKYELAFEAIEALAVNHLLDPETSKELRDIYPGYLKELKEYNNKGEFIKVSERAKRVYEVIPQDDIFYRNKALSELEISQNKLILNSKVRNLIVTLSTACNLKCVMCEARELNWRIPKNRLEEVISYFPYLERLVWQGGEAFLVDYFDELIEKAAKFTHLRQVITTNGLLIDERRAENLVKSNVDLTFSIDGITKDVYEKIRQGADFGLLIKNLGNFNKARKKYNSPLLNTNLHVVIMKSNYHQMEEYIEFAREHEFKLIAFLPIGGNFNNPENIFQSQDELALKFIERITPDIEEKAKKYGILLENRLPKRNKEEPVTLGEITSPVENYNRDTRLLCHLPWIQLYIDFDGSIRPDCVCRPDQAIGHADRDSLADVWNNAKMQEYRKIIIDGSYSRICNRECVRGQVSERYLKFS